MGRFCVEDYQKPIGSKFKQNIYSQLTNYSVNKMHKDYKYDSEDSHKKTMSDVFRMLEAEGHDTLNIWEDIKSLTSELMEIMYPYIYHNYRLLFGNDKNPKHFHIIGIDIILDQNCKPWLLEINDRPSLSISHEDEIGTRDLKNKMHVSEIDLRIKEPIVYDSICLVKMRNRTVLAMQKFGVFERV